jgi:hypothetical protein
MGNFSGPQAMKDNRRKMMLTGTMVRGFTIIQRFCSEISILNFATS